MDTVYTETNGGASVDYRGVSTVKPIEAAKAAVAVEELAEKLSGPGLRRGDEILFICPLHDDHSPSLRVNPEKGVWNCFPCDTGGDVVRLAQLVWRHTDDGRGAAEAAACLLMEFGHEVPGRPPAWFRKQERQRPMREAVDEVRKNVLCRRLFKYSILPMIDAIEDAGEREAELERAWPEFRRLLP